MLFTKIAQTWAVQRDSVNTVIIHSYLTLPHNERIHGLSKIIGIYKVYQIDQFCSNRQDPKTEDRTSRFGRDEVDPQRTDVGGPKPSCAVCPTLTGPIFRYAHLVPKGPESIRQKTLGHSVCDIIG